MYERRSGRNAPTGRMANAKPRAFSPFVEPAFHKHHFGTNDETEIVCGKNQKGTALSGKSALSSLTNSMNALFLVRRLVLAPR
jgi:hypothetical protein